MHKWVKGIICSFLSIAISSLLVQLFVSIEVNTYFEWLIYAIVCGGLSVVVTSLTFGLFNKQIIKEFFNQYVRR